MSQYISSILKLTKDGISSLAMTPSLIRLQTQILESFPYYSRVFQLQVAETQFKLTYAKKGRNTKLQERIWLQLALGTGALGNPGWPRLLLSA